MPESEAKAPSMASIPPRPAMRPALRHLGCRSSGKCVPVSRLHEKAKRQPAALVRASADDDAEGVRALLRRDSKRLDLEAAETAFQDGSRNAQPAAEPPAGIKQAEASRSEEATSTSAPATPAGPRTAGEAIAEGIQRLQGGDAEAAVQLFQRALELPGKGAYRLSGSPREYSCASEGEEQAALVNLACAYCALGRKEAALASLEGALEAGFRDFGTLRSDPDLEMLRGPALELLLAKAQGRGLLAGLNPFGRKR